MNARRIPWGTRLALRTFRRYRHAQAALHDLTYLFWECTLRCNLNCLHCGSDCTREAAAPDMPLDDFLRVLDEVRAQYKPAKVAVVLTGGEPSLRADLESAGRAFRERGFPWGMVSNGYGLGVDRFRRLLESGLGSLTISLDGLEEDHNWLRGRLDSFTRAVDAIRNAAAVPGLVFDVVTCVNQRNFGSLKAIEGLLIGLGVKQWRLFTIFPKGRAQGDATFDLSSGQFRSLLDFIEAARKDKRILASYGCEGFLGAYEGHVRNGLFWCRAGINIGSVLADGSVSACPSLRGDYIQGNIYRDRFLDCWNNRFQVMRDRSWTRTGVCAECDAFGWCEGNGLHLRDAQSGHLLRCHYHWLAGER
ncbi:MAG: TIGR04133 family radical SAM/SPASM protein [Candidatus Hydrogenedentes bacterium]|nr:TIGR04133 family radical SAM/SPASM protein [Candidatus Hydrogenedentota bacterium]